MTNPCAVLGVPPSATAEEVKAKYYELVKLNHPDVGGSEAMMQELATAYRMLTINRDCWLRTWRMRSDLCLTCQGDGTIAEYVSFTKRNFVLCKDCHGTGLLGG